MGVLWFGEFCLGRAVLGPRLSLFCVFWLMMWTIFSSPCSIFPSYYPIKATKQGDLLCPVTGPRAAGFLLRLLPTGPLPRESTRKHATVLQLSGSWVLSLTAFSLPLLPGLEATLPYNCHLCLAHGYMIWTYLALSQNLEEQEHQGVPLELKGQRLPFGPMTLLCYLQTL